MRAVTFHEHGGLEVLRYEDVAEPTFGSDDVLIQVRAVSVNPGPDTMTRARGFGYPGFRLPHVSGSDPAGEVVAVGSDVDGVRVGDRVVVYPVLRCGTCDLCARGVPANYCRNFRMFGIHTWGGRAEYVAVPQANVVILPDAVSYEMAAALPVSYITTWHGIIDRGAIKPDDTLLVVGAGGGCGVAAVQIARHVGARTIALTGAPEKAERLRELGATVLSYRDDDWPSQVREASGHGVSIAFDNTGNVTWGKTLTCLDRGGRMVCSGATFGERLEVDVRALYREQISLLFNVQGTLENLEQLVELAATGAILPVVNHRLPLSEVVEAERLLASGNQFGKIVLVPDPFFDATGSQPAAQRRVAGA